MPRFSARVSCSYRAPLPSSSRCMNASRDQGTDDSRRQVVLPKWYHVDGKKRHLMIPVSLRNVRTNGFNAYACRGDAQCTVAGRKIEARQADMRTLDEYAGHDLLQVKDTRFPGQE